MDLSNFPWLTTLLGAVAGYYGGGMFKQPTIGAIVGGGAGYLFGGGQLPGSSTTLQIPTVTVKAG